MNDIENIVPFMIIGFIYVGTGPSASWAQLLFRAFTAARFLHTFVYAIFVIPQPARALSFTVGAIVNLLMVFSILSTYVSAM